MLILYACMVFVYGSHRVPSVVRSSLTKLCSVVGTAWIRSRRSTEWSGRRRCELSGARRSGGAHFRAVARARALRARRARSGNRARRARRAPRAPRARRARSARRAAWAGRESRRRAAPAARARGSGPAVTADCVILGSFSLWILTEPLYVKSSYSASLCLHVVSR